LNNLYKYSKYNLTLSDSFTDPATLPFQVCFRGPAFSPSGVGALEVALLDLTDSESAPKIFSA